MWQYMCVYTGYVTVHVCIYWICDSTCVYILDMWQYMCVYTGYVTVHVCIYWICDSTCVYILDMWQYMCLYTGYVTVHVCIYWICDSTCVYILDMQLHQQAYIFFLIYHHQFHCVAQTITADNHFSTTDQFPNFNLCATRGTCAWKLKTCLFHVETILSPLTQKVSQSNIMLLFMHSLFFTHLFIALAEMFECPNLFPQYALCNSTSSFKVGESCWMWLHCSFIWTCPLEQGLNTILIAIVRCLMGMLSRLLEMEFQIICTQLKKKDCVPYCKQWNTGRGWELGVVVLGVGFKTISVINQLSKSHSTPLFIQQPWHVPQMSTFSTTAFSLGSFCFPLQGFSR